MITKEHILETVSQEQILHPDHKPIYEIMMIQHADKELVYPTGKHSGFPDTGCTAVMGFYYDLDDAEEAVASNGCDIHEHLYNAAFILARFPGLYQAVGNDMRLYFVWDKENEIFVQKEEPKIFAHIAY